LEIESLELFAQVGHKLWSSWSQPPKQQRLQVWALVPGSLFFIYHYNFGPFECFFKWLTGCLYPMIWTVLFCPLI
jgi:hypothetical protein